MHLELWDFSHFLGAAIARTSLLSLSSSTRSRNSAILAQDLFESVLARENMEMSRRVLREFLVKRVSRLSASRWNRSALRLPRSILSIDPLSVAS